MFGNCDPIEYPDPNLTEWVAQVHGPRCLPHNYAVATTVMYSIVFFVGFLGNLITCIVIFKNPRMHTAANYYLFSLAVSDLLFLALGLPFELHSVMSEAYPYSLPSFVCKARGFVSEWTTYTSLLTITAFAVERWVAICFPLFTHKFSTLSRVWKIVAFLWLISLVSAAPLLKFMSVQRLPIPEGYEIIDESIIKLITEDGITIRYTEYCSASADARAQAVIIHLSFWLFFVVPMLLMTVIFIHIRIVMSGREKKEELRRTFSAVYKRQRSTTHKTVFRMLLAVAVVFFICWLPFHFQRLMVLFLSEQDWEKPIFTEAYNAIFYISGYFYYASAAVNPVLYSALNVRFRRAFIQTMLFCVKSERLRERFPDTTTYTPSRSPSCLMRASIRSTNNSLAVRHSLSPSGSLSRKFPPSKPTSATVTPKSRTGGLLSNGAPYGTHIARSDDDEVTVDLCRHEPNERVSTEISSSF